MMSDRMPGVTPDTEGRRGRDRGGRRLMDSETGGQPALVVAPFAVLSLLVDEHEPRVCDGGARRAEELPGLAARGLLRAAGQVG